VSDITKAQIKKAIEDDVIFGDGHTIYKSSVYRDHFDLPDRLVRTYKSDTSDHKSTIYANDGSIIPELHGVYNLDFLRWLVIEVGLLDKAGSRMGRGSQAQEYVRVLRDWSNEDD
jgi:hypothetical protein